jgi:hypothetical protein
VVFKRDRVLKAKPGMSTKSEGRQHKKGKGKNPELGTGNVNARDIDTQHCEENSAPKTKTSSGKNAGERLQKPVRPPDPTRPECEIISKDPSYTLVASKDGKMGTYRVDTIEFSVERVSDYLTKVEENGKITGRRPLRANKFAKYKDIIAELKNEGQKWVDGDSPQRKDGYKEGDMIKEPFIYRPANEVWPTKVKPGF